MLDAAKEGILILTLEILKLISIGLIEIAKLIIN